MDKLQVSVACALLMMLDPTSAQCQQCPTGFYMTRNCTVRNGVGYGTRCAPCSDCSVLLMETLVPCSAYADSVCMNRTTAVPAVSRTEGSAATMWIGLGAAASSLVLVLVLVLVFTWMTCKSKGKFTKLLPLKASSPEQKAPPTQQCDALIGVPV